MGRGVLDDKTLVTFHAIENGRLFNGPFADIRPV